MMTVSVASLMIPDSVNILLNACDRGSVITATMRLRMAEERLLR